MGLRDIDKQEVLAGAGGVVVVKGWILYGSSGAVTDYCSMSGVTNITDEAQGKWNIYFDRVYKSLVSMSPATGYIASGEKLDMVVAVDPATTLDDGYLTVELRNEAGTATDPSSGDIYYFEFSFDTLGLRT